MLGYFYTCNAAVFKLLLNKCKYEISKEYLNACKAVISYSVITLPSIIYYTEIYYKTGHGRNHFLHVVLQVI